MLANSQFTLIHMKCKHSQGLETTLLYYCEELVVKQSLLTRMRIMQ